MSVIEKVRSSLQTLLNENGAGGVVIAVKSDLSLEGIYDEEISAFAFGAVPRLAGMEELQEPYIRATSMALTARIRITRDQSQA
jgi:hypothetical protein